MGYRFSKRASYLISDTGFEEGKSHVGRQAQLQTSLRWNKLGNIIPLGEIGVLCLTALSGEEAVLSVYEGVQV